MTHEELVVRAEKWLLNTLQCPFVIPDHFTVGNDQPDAIGFKRFGTRSILVECKMSRSDFHADKKKIRSMAPHLSMGDWRYYLCPPGVIHPEDLPEGWRLLWAYPKQIKRIHDPNGDLGVTNIAPDFEKRAEKERQLIMAALAQIQEKLGAPFSSLAKPKKEAG